MDSPREQPAARPFRTLGRETTPQKTTAVAPVFLSRAEDRFAHLSSAKKKKGASAFERTAQQIEGCRVGTGGAGWLMGMRKMRTVWLGDRFLPAKGEEEEEPAGEEEDAGGEEEARVGFRGDVLPLPRRWPTVVRPKRAPFLLGSARAPQVESPPETGPPSEPRISSYSSDVSSLLSSYAASGYQSNAFAPSGFWASHGYRSAPLAEEVERFGRAARSHCSSDSEVSSLLEPETTRRPVSLAFSTDTEVSCPDTSFDMMAFLRSIDVFGGVRTKDKHPFPDLRTIPNEEVLKETYKQVKETLVAFWYSHLEAKREKEPVIPPTFRSMISAPPLRPTLTHSQTEPTSSERPRLLTKPSRLRIFSRTKSSTKLAIDSDSDDDIPIPPPAPPLTDETQKKCLPQGMDTTTLEAIELTRIVLERFVQDFVSNNEKYASMEEYIINRPRDMFEEMKQLLEDEELYRKQYNIKNRAQLCDKSYWYLPVYVHPRDDTDPDSPDPPSKEEYETILDKQRRGLRMIRRRRNSKEFRVPVSALRIIWATQFFTRAEETHRLAVKKFESQRLMQAYETRRRVDQQREMDRRIRALDLNGDDDDLYAEPSSEPKLQRQPKPRRKYEPRDERTRRPKIERSPGSDDNADIEYASILKTIARESSDLSKRVQSGSSGLSKRVQSESSDLSRRVQRRSSDLSKAVEQTASPPSPPEVPPKDSESESPEQARIRRRKTTFNMGLMSAYDTSPSSYEAAPSSPGHVSGWEKELQMGIDREKMRQQTERVVSGGSMRSLTGSAVRGGSIRSRRLQFEEEQEHDQGEHDPNWYHAL